MYGKFELLALVRRHRNMDVKHTFWINVLFTIILDC